ncbi:hypothetical protein LO82_22305 [Vibrio vulnificus]|nr:hypothetical protein LO82_22305 [Vibrio vulnificus]
MLKWNAVTSVLRASPLNWALGKGQKSSLFLSSYSLWQFIFRSRQFSIVGLNSSISPAVKHAKFRGLPHWFSVLVGGEFHWHQVWKGQANRSFRFCGQFTALSFSGSKAALSLKGCVS